MKKPIVIIIITVLIILVALMIYIIYSDIRTSKDTNVVKQIIPTAQPLQINYSDYNQNIVSTPLQKDSIAPIDAPKYVSIEQADAFLVDKSKVFVYEAKDGVYIYPQKILIWHEIVNEPIDGEAISVTYCPLTGSAICYLGDVANHKDNTYGTSGKLINSNLLMYDRDTDSYIPQILGIGINNQLEGVTLATHPIHWANWEDVKSTYDSAQVLSLDTGYERDYFLDPYGSYEFAYEDSYYQSEEIMFPIMNENDGAFSEKKVVVGVKYKDYVLALDPLLVENQNVVNFTISDIKAVAFYDEQLKVVRVFDAEMLQFSYEKGQIKDQHNAVWTPLGTSEDVGTALSPLTYFDVMWFAWHAYYPDTEVVR
ncbi:MAG: DUF3179 domain-containing protein [Clostridiales bacterium]|nr:DUF3179 domain-containing protein [Clostridiales bacterium]